MADAKICDRCGDYYAPDDTPTGDVHLVAKAVQSITVSADDITTNNRQGLLGPDHQQAAREITEHHSVETLDLCDECQAELDEWWQDGEEVDA